MAISLPGDATPSIDTVRAPPEALSNVDAMGTVLPSPPKDVAPARISSSTLANQPEPGPSNQGEKSVAPEPAPGLANVDPMGTPVSAGSYAVSAEQDPQLEFQAVKPNLNPFDAFDSDADAGDAGLLERARLNSIDSYYRGDPTGAGYLRNLADMATTPESPDDTPAVKKNREKAREEYQGIITDLARYDLLAPWGSAGEAASALGGQLWGNLTPSMLLRIPVGLRYAPTVTGRITEGAVQGALTNWATDPASQTLAVEAGALREYDPMRTLLAGPVGAVVGGGLVGGGQVVSSGTIRAWRAVLGREDPSLRAAGDKLVVPSSDAKAAAGEGPRPASADNGPNAEHTPPESGTPPPASSTSTAVPAPVDLKGNQLEGSVHRVSTPDGRSIEVQPTVVEAADLITSGDHGFDPALQPRDRDRAASQQQIREIAANLDPERLGFSSEADRGAPIVGPDRMVESGNGRVMAIREAYAQGGEAAQRYRDWIASQGVDVSGFKEPVIVRQRITELSPEDRAKFTLAANQSATLTLSASERALADARSITPDMLDLIRRPDDLGAIGNRDFIRSFVGKLPQAEQGGMLTAEGGLSSEGLTRVRNAVLGAAYGDAPVLTRIAEATNDEVKSISNALVSIAPTWAKLRADVSAGHVRADIDQTGAMIEAVTRTADLRGKGVKLEAFLAQQDAFDRVSPVVENFMRMFYDSSGRRAVGANRIADALRFYAEEGRKVTEGGLDLGLPPVTVEELQRVARERTQRTGAEGQGELPDSNRGGNGSGTSAPGGEVPGRGSGGAREGAAGEGAVGDRGGATGARAGGEPDLLGISTAKRLSKEQPSLFHQREAEGQQRLPGTMEGEGPSLRDRLEAQTKGPIAGGNAAPKEGGLFDEGARAQKDLFGLHAMTPEEQALAERRGGGVLKMEQKRPAQGVPGNQVATQTGTAVAPLPEPPSPQKQVAIRSLQQQAFDFAKAIDFPLHQGRVSLRGALGIYKTKQGVVRVKEVPDFEVVAHEAGHAIEGKAGKDLTRLTKQHIAELGPLDYDQSKKRANEGFAEYIRRYIGNPAAAQQVAPTFSSAFESFMTQKHPDMWAAINNASEAYRRYLQAPSVDAVAAVRRSRDEEPHGFRFLLSEMRELGFAGTIRAVMAHSYTVLSDENAPFARAVREQLAAIKAKEGKLVELKAADNPEILKRLFGRWEHAGILDMRDGVRPYHSVVPEGPSLADALTKATGQPSILGKWDTELRGLFSDYLIARRAEYLWRKHEAGLLQNPPVSFSHADARVAITEHERANPQFVEAAGMVHDYTRQLLRKSFEGHLIGRDLYERLLQEEFYVPFMRDLSDRPLAGGDSAMRGSADRVADVVKRLRGSSRDIMDPVESLMTQTFLVNRTVKHNDIILALEGLAKRAGIEGGKYFEKVPAHEAQKYTFDLKDAIERAGNERGIPPDDMKFLTSAVTDVFGEDPLIGHFFRMEPAGKRGEPIVFYKRGGELQVGRIMSGEEGHALYETLTSLPNAISDLGLQILSASSTVLRSGVTTNPVYALTNYIRDQVAAGILRSDYIPFVSGWRGIWQEVRQKEPAKLYGYAGGVSPGAAIAAVKEAADRQVDALAKDGYLINRLTSLHGLLELASVTEAGTRNSIFDKVYRDKKANGLSDYEAMIEAAYQAQDILDFSRWGSKTMAIRALTPFVNAHIQGLDKARRTLFEPLFRQALTQGDVEARRNAVQGLVKFFAVGSALGAAWAALHHSDEIYRDARNEMVGTHFVTSIGGKILLIPKPFELSLGFTAGEYAYKRLMNDDPRAAAAFAEAAYEVLKPPIPIFANPLIKTPAELVSNYSFFTGRAIVPDRLQRLDPAQQYTDRTSSLAKFVGQNIGISPIKVDYTLGNMFGLWGRDVAALSGGVDEDAPAQNWEDRVFLRRFLKDPTRSSETTQKFWDFMSRTTGKYSQAVSTYDSLVKGFRDDQASAFLAKLPDDQRAYVTMRSAANEDGKPAFGAPEKRLHPLQRAQDAVTILNGLRGEMQDNSFKLLETGVNVKLSPEERRDLLDNIRELAQKEMRNALVITKADGYANRPVFDLQATMDKIEKISPAVADEIKTRYATSKIYKTQAIASGYEDLKKDVLRDGGEADLSRLRDVAEEAGVEFDGERVKKPPKRRVPIKGRP